MRAPGVTNTWSMQTSSTKKIRLICVTCRKQLARADFDESGEVDLEEWLLFSLGTPAEPRGLGALPEEIFFDRIDQIYDGVSDVSSLCRSCALSAELLV